MSSSSMFEDIFRDVMRQRINTKSSLSLEASSAVQANVYAEDMLGKVSRYQMHCQRLIDHLFAHGFSVYLARNRDDEMMLFLYERDAAKWLAENPGTGTIKSCIEALEMSLSPEIPHE